MAGALQLADTIKNFHDVKRRNLVHALGDAGGGRKMFGIGVHLAFKTSSQSLDRRFNDTGTGVRSCCANSDTRNSSNSQR